MNKITSQRWNFDQMFRKEKQVNLIAGVDEAGRGALAGPIVVAGVILPSDYDNWKIRDSKKIHANNREKLFYEIVDVAISYNIEIISHYQVENLNPKKASILGMINCLTILKPQAEFCLIDGEKISVPNLKTQQLIKGDDLSLSIGAASILAKFTRDQLMNEYDTIYPGYNFKRNKGYGTKEHLEKLSIIGICSIHRKTYKPVIKYLNLFK